MDAAPLNENGERTASVTFRARRVFCCAGSMGTTRLLLRSRETVPGLQTLHAEGGLGTHWGNNGDVLLRRVGVLAAVAGRAGGPSLFSFHGAGTAKHPFQVRVVHTPGPDVIDWSFVQLAMAPVAATGRFEWDAEANDWRLKWDANAGGGGRPSSDDIDAAARALLNRLPGSAFSVLGNSSGATFHPLGGCVLGVGTERDGQVRHCPGLHVIDSALIPGHTGGNNPAWTVAALAEVVIRRVIGA